MTYKDEIFFSQKNTKVRIRSQRLNSKLIRVKATQMPTQPKEFYNYTFFAQTVLIKLDSPQAAQLDFFCIGKSVVLHFHGGPD